MLHLEETILFNVNPPLLNNFLLEQKIDGKFSVTFGLIENKPFVTTSRSFSNKYKKRISYTHEEIEINFANTHESIIECLHYLLDEIKYNWKFDSCFYYLQGDVIVNNEFPNGNILNYVLPNKHQSVKYFICIHKYFLHKLNIEIHDILQNTNDIAFYLNDSILNIDVKSFPINKFISKFNSIFDERNKLNLLSNNDANGLKKYFNSLVRRNEYDFKYEFEDKENVNAYVPIVNKMIDLKEEMIIYFNRCFEFKSLLECNTKGFDKLGEGFVLTLLTDDKNHDNIEQVKLINRNKFSFENFKIWDNKRGGKK